MLGLCNFLFLAIQFLLLGLNFLEGNGQFLFSLSKMLALLIGLLLDPCQSSLSTFPFLLNFSKLKSKVFAFLFAITNVFTANTLRASSSFNLK